MNMKRISLSRGVDFIPDFNRRKVLYPLDSGGKDIDMQRFDIKVGPNRNFDLC